MKTRTDSLFPMIIKNTQVYDEAGTLMKASVYIDSQGKLSILTSNMIKNLPYTINVFDAQNEFAIFPGLFDTHVHGYGGPDFSNANEENIHTIMKALGDTGLSYAMATLVSAEITQLKKSLKAINHYYGEQKNTPGVARLVGVHLEGPFISKQCKGAHAEHTLQTSLEMKIFKDIISAAPAIKNWKMTISPDLPYALEFIQKAKLLEKEGVFVKIFIGHSNPLDVQMISKAIEAGVVGFTHLGNACGETSSRLNKKLEYKDVSSRVVQWVLKNPAQCPPGIELIVDGVHLSSSFVKLFDPKKVVLVTDALGPSGLKDGPYQLGSLPIIKEEKNFYLADKNHLERVDLKDGTLPNGLPGKVKTLAGSAASLVDCIHRFTQWNEFSRYDFNKKMDLLYQILVKNPRQSALGANNTLKLDDTSNFVLVNKNGECVFSVIFGKMISHGLKMPHLLQKKLLSPHLFRPETNYFLDIPETHQNKKISFQ